MRPFAASLAGVHRRAPSIEQELELCSRINPSTLDYSQSKTLAEFSSCDPNSRSPPLTPTLPQRARKSWLPRLNFPTLEDMGHLALQPPTGTSPRSRRSWLDVRLPSYKDQRSEESPVPQMLTGRSSHRHRSYFRPFEAEVLDMREHPALGNTAERPLFSRQSTLHLPVSVTNDPCPSTRVVFPSSGLSAGRRTPTSSSIYSRSTSESDRSTKVSTISSFSNNLHDDGDVPSPPYVPKECSFKSRTPSLPAMPARYRRPSRDDEYTE